MNGKATNDSWTSFAEINQKMNENIPKTKIKKWKQQIKRVDIILKMTYYTWTIFKEKQNAQTG